MWVKVNVWSDVSELFFVSRTTRAVWKLAVHLQTGRNERRNLRASCQQSLYTSIVHQNGIYFLYSFVPISSLRTHLHFFSHLGSCGCCSFRILAEVFLQSLPVRPGSSISLIYQNVLASSRCLWLHLVANWGKNKNKHVKGAFANVGSTEIIQNMFMFNFQQ